MTSPDASAIELRALKFAYSAQQTVVSIDALNIPRGKHIFLHGPSGTGKTTVLGLIAGILQPTSGTVKVLGQDLAQLGSAARDRFRGDHVGYIFQMFNLLPYLNVRQNILLASQMSKVRSKKVAAVGLQSQLDNLVNGLGIAQLLDRKATELSVGQQQRVAAARALLGSPEIIIADEPTSALDYDHREAFLKLLFDQADRTGTTVLFVSHDQSLKSMFHEVISLRDINHVKAAAHANS